MAKLRLGQPVDGGGANVSAYYNWPEADRMRLQVVASHHWPPSCPDGASLRSFCSSNTEWVEWNVWNHGMLMHIYNPPKEMFKPIVAEPDPVTLVIPSASSFNVDMVPGPVAFGCLGNSIDWFPQVTSTHLQYAAEERP